MPGGARPHYRSSLLELLLFLSQSRLVLGLRLVLKHPALVSSEGYSPCVASLLSLPSLDPERLLSTINCKELVCVVSVPSFALFAGLFFLILFLFFGMSYSQCTRLAVKNVNPGLGVSP